MINTQWARCGLRLSVLAKPLAATSCELTSGGGRFPGQHFMSDGAEVIGECLYFNGYVKSLDVNSKIIIVKSHVRRTTVWSSTGTPRTQTAPLTIRRIQFISRAGVILLSNTHDEQLALWNAADIQVMERPSFTACNGCLSLVGHLAACAWRSRPGPIQMQPRRAVPPPGRGLIRLGGGARSSPPRPSPQPGTAHSIRLRALR